MKRLYRYPWDRAEETTVKLLSVLDEIRTVNRIQPCGSFRRGKETVKDLDIIIETDRPLDTMNAVVRRLGSCVEEVVPVEGLVLAWVDGMPVDIWSRAPIQFGAACVHNTGPIMFSLLCKHRARQNGFYLDSRGLWDGDTLHPAGGSEIETFRAIGLNWIPPVERQ